MADVRYCALKQRNDMIFKYFFKKGSFLEEKVIFSKKPLKADLIRKMFGFLTSLDMSICTISVQNQLNHIILHISKDLLILTIDIIFEEKVINNIILYFYGNSVNYFLIINKLLKFLIILQFNQIKIKKYIIICLTNQIL
jgi:hypothetical protein